ncbi:hypothetical protein [Candidatus Aquiluna sp. UB-MaderosW2red]|uniref:hypothetical protein n=1 Tax=Candidatus Aquiluna sp. UB-MaderosW2red TaxID=1855377 RepID=UPI000875D570|nr:hypothetical protein [Candidatus Aquiluna sp. UB-MaderosW2red]SCX05794.1 hypothetical protein SAMN05216534_0447 [Candidatus Aquiluna sp. UB-MaderosW2red]
MNLQDLINQGDQLLDEEAGSSLVRFWQSESLETIKGHGEGAVGALEGTFRYAMIMRNKPESQRRQAESIKRSQKLMRVL